ncbi:tRNA(Met) cytidine acetyltransferase TmcA [Colwellia psychrerythraea]|uniref:tRNA(Met) cytidine acetyltransferase TmcA n=1 Tax=Colwellia psychrerythraea TaxID=28229 RepID=A0A099KC50_COLPS|nr:GNAT family N-acetyltransferase [Colwellia psychrerythraea]KGJ87123.1 tRNA(Met) cytidine acetyltransferase TmcA [Colwellia psychrerythraea]
MSAQLFTSWFDKYTKNAYLLSERRLIVLSGSDSWALSLIESLDIFSSALRANSNHATDSGHCLIYGDSGVFPANVQNKRYRDKLGSESDMIIFADSQFTIDAFAALSGTLKAGGIFFLIAPEIKLKRECSLFLRRFYSLIEVMPEHTVISQAKVELPVNLGNISKQGKQDNKQLYSFDCITAEQHTAVKAIKKVVTGHRKRPLVLTADRGRGKSSALAIACAQLLKAHEHNEFSIIITAPDTQALSVFYRQLTKSLGAIELQGNKITYGKARLTFIAVDQLIRERIKVNLLLVDEAAAISVYLLEQLLNSYHRMVFSSTVHGYEGAGRGFTLKFQKTLDRLCPQWVSLHLNQPIRWRENDPLEQLVFDACLLNAELPDLKTTIVPQPLFNSKVSSPHKVDNIKALDEVVFKVIPAKELVADDVLLKQVFAVLVTAHYQTKPSDLQLLLDNPQVQVTCLFSSQNKNADILAVALLMHEGKGHGVTIDDVRAVKNSEQRLRNHFLPQSLFSHCGFEKAFDFVCLRIMRIAVHPQIQQQGLGSKFIRHIELLAVKQGVDFIGSSFGVNPELLSFWLNAGFSPARIGFTKDKASGEHSALLIKALSEKSKEAQQHLHSNFYQSFDYLLLEEYKTLSTELVLLLLRQNTKEDLKALSAQDIANVWAFSRGERLYSSCSYSLYLWLKHELLSEAKYHSTELLQHSLVLIARLIQKQDSDSVCQQFGLTGKKMLNKHIKDYVYSRLTTLGYE